MSKPVTSMLDIIKLNIATNYTKAAAEQFVSNPVFVGCEAYDDTVQRGLANRVLIRKLLAFRAKSNVKVVDAIYCLIPDGDNESWMNVFKLVILPFLKENNVQL